MVKTMVDIVMSLSILRQIQSLICKICYLPSRDPYLSVCCGHDFCKSCLDNVKAAAITNACPVCRDEEFVSFLNKQAN